MNKKRKIFGVGLVVMLVASLLAFAAPVSAEEFAPKPNTWTGYCDWEEGSPGGYFFDPAITEIGPIAESLNGTLFCYFEDASAPAMPYDILISNDGGRSWMPSMAPGRYNGGQVVDMVCSSLYEDVLYVTDGNYVYKSADGGMNYSIIARENLELALRGECGLPITHEPITCIDVAYNGGDEPIVFIGTRYVGHHYPIGHADPGDAIVGTVLWIAEDTYPAEWSDLQLSCYGCCNTDGTVAPATFDDTGVNAYAGDQTYSGSRDDCQ